MMNRRGRGGGIDMAKMAEALARPGLDTRNFIEEGTVCDGEDAVDFDEVDDLGGPSVWVNLQPSKITIKCRLLQTSAGKGEGEWSPFVEGDHVLVCFPRGTSKNGGIIIGRLNNSIDKFPGTNVAGQDPSGNTFAFKRQRTAFTHEIAGTYTVREATSGSFLTLDATTGNVTLKDGSNGALQLSADLFGYQSGDAKYLLQMDSSGKRFMVQVGDAMLRLAAGDSNPRSSTLVSPGPFSVSANAQPAAEHVATTEAVFNILSYFLKALGTANPGPILGAVLGGAADGILAAAALLAAVGPLNPAIAGAVAGAFASALQKPPGVPGLGQASPGIGCAGFLVG